MNFRASAGAAALALSALVTPAEARFERLETTMKRKKLEKKLEVRRGATGGSATERPENRARIEGAGVEG